MATVLNDPTTVAPPGGMVEQQKSMGSAENSGAAAEIVSWVMKWVNEWRAIRDQEHAADWDRYYRLWRGQWAAEDKNRNSERSRIICPDLAESVELTHAEITEAVFGRGMWFDLPDDVEDQDKKDMEKTRALLSYDLECAGIPDAIGKCIQIGTLYGTGVGKISVEKEPYREIKTSQAGPELVESQRTVVKVYPLDVREVVPDPSTDTISEMLGVAHETVLPYHVVRGHQMSGFFFDGELGTVANPPPSNTATQGEGQGKSNTEGSVFITEWHGKIPVRFYRMLQLELGANADGEIPETEDELMESVVTIGNSGTLLRAKPNVTWFQERAIVAYQHETVPGEFWGRGVAEKGMNAQSALDSTVRMRLDAGALVAAPMVAADKSRLPRGFDYKVYPGKEWPTVGDPKEVVMGFSLGQVNPALFEDTSTLQQMVKQATGAMDPGTSLSQGSRRDTMGGTAMMAASTVKRNRRTMLNIENQFLQPLLRQITRLYVQFAPSRYPQDLNFSVKGAMGIMAREYEQAYLTQLYSTTTPDDGPVRLLILREVFEASSSPNKQELVSAIDQMLAPPDEQAQQKKQMMEELGMRKLMAEVNLIENQAVNQGAQASEHAAKGQNIVLEGELKDEELTIKAAQVQVQSKEADTYRLQTELSAHDGRFNKAAKVKELQQKDRKLAIDEQKANKPASK